MRRRRRCDSLATCKSCLFIIVCVCHIVNVTYRTHSPPLKWTTKCCCIPLESLNVTYCGIATQVYYYFFTTVLHSQGRKIVLCTERNKVVGMVLIPTPLQKFRVVGVRGVDPYGTGGHVPQYLWRRGRPWSGAPSNILEVMSFRMSTRVSTRNYVQILKESG